MCFVLFVDYDGDVCYAGYCTDMLVPGMLGHFKNSLAAVTSFKINFT